MGEELVKGMEMEELNVENTMVEMKEGEDRPLGRSFGADQQRRS